jgi:uncharacterized protein (TIRG00374 family)
MRRLAVGFGLTVVSIVLLTQLIDWGRTWATLERAHIGFIALAVTSLLLSLGFKTARWRLLLPATSPVTGPRLFRILHISFLLNNVLPARLGDVARVAMTSRQPGLRVGHVLSSLLTERVADTVTLLTAFVLVSPFLPIPARYAGWLEIAWWAMAAIVAAALATVLLRGTVVRAARLVPFPRRLRESKLLAVEMRSFADGFAQIYAPNRVLPVWGLSLLAWLGAFAINYWLMLALRIDAPFTVAVLLTCTTNLAMLIPSSPGYIGVFHAAATLALLPFGVGAAQALSFAILAHLVNVVPVSILGAVFLAAGRDPLPVGWRNWRPSPAVEVGTGGGGGA